MSSEIRISDISKKTYGNKAEMEEAYTVLLEAANRARSNKLESLHKVMLRSQLAEPTARVRAMLGSMHTRRDGLEDIVRIIDESLTAAHNELETTQNQYEAIKNPLHLMNLGVFFALRSQTLQANGQADLLRLSAVGSQLSATPRKRTEDQSLWRISAQGSPHRHPFSEVELTAIGLPEFIESASVALPATVMSEREFLLHWLFRECIEYLKNPEANDELLANNAPMVHKQLNLLVYHLTELLTHEVAQSRMASRYDDQPRYLSVEEASTDSDILAFTALESWVMPITLASAEQVDNPRHPDNILMEHPQDVDANRTTGDMKRELVDRQLEGNDVWHLLLELCIAQAENLTPSGVLPGDVKRLTRLLRFLAPTPHASHEAGSDLHTIPVGAEGKLIQFAMLIARLDSTRYGVRGRAEVLKMLKAMGLEVSGQNTQSWPFIESLVAVSLRDNIHSAIQNDFLVAARDLLRCEPDYQAMQGKRGILDAALQPAGAVEISAEDLQTLATVLAEKFNLINPWSFEGVEDSRWYQNFAGRDEDASSEDVQDRAHRTCLLEHVEDSMQLAQLCDLAGQTELAITIVERLRDLTGPTQSAARIINHAGEALLHAGYPQLADKYFETAGMQARRAPTAHAEIARAFYNRGDIALRAGDIETATTLFGRAMDSARVHDASPAYELLAQSALGLMALDAGTPGDQPAEARFIKAYLTEDSDVARRALHQYNEWRLRYDLATRPDASESHEHYSTSRTRPPSDAATLMHDHTANRLRDIAGLLDGDPAQVNQILAVDHSLVFKQGRQTSERLIADNVATDRDLAILHRQPGSAEDLAVLALTLWQRARVPDSTFERAEQLENILTAAVATPNENGNMFGRTLARVLKYGWRLQNTEAEGTPPSIDELRGILSSLPDDLGGLLGNMLAAIREHDTWTADMVFDLVLHTALRRPWEYRAPETNESPTS